MRHADIVDESRATLQEPQVLPAAEGTPDPGRSGHLWATPGAPRCPDSQGRRGGWDGPPRGAGSAEVSGGKWRPTISAALWVSMRPCARLTTMYSLPSGIPVMKSPRRRELRNLIRRAPA